MNDVLWKFLNDFCSIYLNDILIYSKTRKKHVQHVRKMLQKLINSSLQINIKKCEFHKQKISFLKVLLSIEDIRMNFRKM